MTVQEKHITVCVCTYKRLLLLARLLYALEDQRADGFTYSIVVADNDSTESARSVVESFSAIAHTRIIYCVEPEQNIARVRNCALQHSDGEFLAFIDDDEVPGEDWLLQLFRACTHFDVDGILGPVKPYFDLNPPAWAIKGRFFERPDHPTGYKLKSGECRTGNVLIRRRILDGIDLPFRIVFNTGGEDVDFFRRMIDRGCVFSWCSNAAVYELVPPERCRRRFLLKRALLRGSNFPKHPVERTKHLLKSVVAVPSYALALPILAAFGHHIFLKYLIKLFDHGSRILAFLGWSVIKERET